MPKVRTLKRRGRMTIRLPRGTDVMRLMSALVVESFNTASPVGFGALAPGADRRMTMTEAKRNVHRSATERTLYVLMDTVTGRSCKTYIDQHGPLRLNLNADAFEKARSGNAKNLITGAIKIYNRRFARRLHLEL